MKITKIIQLLLIIGISLSSNQIINDMVIGYSDTGILLSLLCISIVTIQLWVSTDKIVYAFFSAFFLLIITAMYAYNYPTFSNLLHLSISLIATGLLSFNAKRIIEKHPPNKYTFGTVITALYVLTYLHSMVLAFYYETAFKEIITDCQIFVLIFMASILAATLSKSRQIIYLTSLVWALCFVRIYFALPDLNSTFHTAALSINILFAILISYYLFKSYKLAPPTNGH